MNAGNPDYQMLINGGLMSKTVICEECEEGEQRQGSLRDRVYEAQLANHREIILNQAIDETVVERVVVQIQNINRADDLVEQEFTSSGFTGFKRDPITLLISSPGGSVDLSFAVVSAIEASKTPVITVAIGRAMSGGFLILLAGHERYAQRYASLMYHELSSGAGGKATEVIEYGTYLEKLQKRISDFVISHSSITEDELEECHQCKTDWYMDAFEALDLGVIDGIWPPGVYTLEESPEEETSDKPPEEI